MIEYIDTHAHLDPKSCPDAGAAIEEARRAGVRWIVVPGIDPETSRQGAQLAEKHPGVCFAPGIHCHEASRFSEDDLPEISSLLCHPKAVALGEVGLDYHYDFTPPPVQRELLNAQMDLARKTGKPLILHCRKAEEDLWRMIKSYQGKLRGVVHCYTGTPYWATKFVEEGFHIGFTGIITFRKAGEIREALKAVPQDRILTETDSPYMTPVPHRGKKNSPALLPLIAEEAARIKRSTIQKMAPVFLRNASECFNLDLKEDILKNTDS